MKGLLGVVMGTGRFGAAGLVLSFGLMTTAACLGFAPAAEHAANKGTVARNFGRLPLSFEANQGQTDARVKFVSRGDGFGLYLTAQEAVLSLHKPTASGTDGRAGAHGRSHLALSPNLKGSVPAPDADKQEAAQESKDSWDVIQMQLAGANPQARTEGEERLPGTANYFLGDDPAKWHANIPTFARVRYREVYPGVDLVYYGNQRQLEYDFVVSPGASERPIRLQFAGASAVSLDAAGNLEIAAKNGSIEFHKPEVYQTVAGVRRPVAGSFRQLGVNTVGFSVGAYDRSKPLVIDPILAYSSYLGGNDQEYVVALAADPSGNAYVTGLTWSLSFPLTPGAFQAVNYATGANQVSTAFVSKFNASGTALLYSTFIGGDAIGDRPHEQGDYGHAIAVDSSGEAYVTGYTFSSNFPVTANAFQKGNRAANSGYATGFVTKLNNTGTGLIYSTFLGGSTLDEPFGITFDAAGNAYVAGVTFSTDFPVTAGVIQTTNRSAAISGFNDFITKLNPTGSGLVYSTYLGGSSENGSELGNLYWENPIVVDKSGNAYVAGFSLSSNFPVTTGAFQTVAHAGYTVTVSKLNPAATGLIYSTYLGGSTFSLPQGLAVDSLGNAYVAGYTDDADFPVTKGAFQTTNKARLNANSMGASQDNGFLSKINPTGTGLVYSTYLGGTTGPWGGDDIYGVAVDSTGDAYVTGAAMSADFPVTANAYQKTNAGATQCCTGSTYTTDAFLTEFNPAGTALVYSTYFGGSGRQNANGPGGYGDSDLAITLGAGGVIHLAGYASSGNFPVTEGAFQTAYSSTQNMGFVAEFDLGAAPTGKDTETSLAASANSVVPGTSVTFTATVKPIAGTAIPTGTVSFSIDEGASTTVALGSTGKATFATSTLPAGAHYILASYSGSATYAASGNGLTEFVVPLTPVFTPPGGTYTAQQNVYITDATSAGVLHYTLDGTAPSIFTSTYSAPLQVVRSKTIEAVAVAASDASSPVVTEKYTIIGSPKVVAEPATAIATPSATLNAQVNTLGLTGVYYFKYGTSASALTIATAKTSLSASTVPVAAKAVVTGLKSKTTYYYQVLVSTAGGGTAGTVLSFTTN